MFLYSYIPFIIMIFSSSLIVKRLLNITKRLQKHSLLNVEPNSFKDERNDDATQSEKAKLNPNGITQIADLQNNKETQVNFKKDRHLLQTHRLRNYNQIYRLLLCLNLVFLILVTPLVLCNSLQILEYYMVRDVCYVLAYLNHSLNSFIYGMSCEAYRNILFGIVRKNTEVSATLNNKS